MRKWIIIGGVLIVGACSLPILWNVPEVRAVAAQRLISSQSRLRSMAVSDKDAKVRLVAISRLTDSGALAGLALTGTSKDERMLAADRLQDQNALADVVISSKEENVRLIALVKLTNQPAMAKVVSKSPDAQIVEQTFAKLTDPEALALVAMESPDNQMRLDAIRKINDDIVLARIASRVASPSIRQAAALRIREAKTLEKAIETTDDTAIRAGLGFSMRAIEACAKVPYEHRARLAANVMELMNILDLKSIADDLGTVEYSVFWSDISKPFTPAGKNVPAATLVHGEGVTIRVTSSKLGKSFARTWTTDFPATIASTDFRPADIKWATFWKTCFRPSRRKPSSIFRTTPAPRTSAKPPSRASTTRSSFQNSPPRTRIPAYASPPSASWTTRSPFTTPA